MRRLPRRVMLWRRARRYAAARERLDVDRFLDAIRNVR